MQSPTTRIPQYMLGSAAALSLSLSGCTTNPGPNYEQPGFFYEVDEAGETVAEPPELPAAVMDAIRATLNGETVMVAGVRIEGSDLYVVYVRNRGFCGSGGCRAQIWRHDRQVTERLEPLPVGRLPIVRLQNGDDGNVRLGVTVSDATTDPYLLGVELNAEGWDPDGWSADLATHIGTPILSRPMLQPIENAGQ